MQIELLKAKMAEDKEDQRTAMQHWSNVQNLKLQEKKLAQDAAYHQAALSKPGTGLMAVFEELKRANPDAATEPLLRKAAEISGMSSMYRTDVGVNQKRAQMMETARAKDPNIAILNMQIGAEKDPAKRAQLQGRLDDIERSLRQRVDNALASEGGQSASAPSALPQGVTVQRLGN